MSHPEIRIRIENLREMNAESMVHESMRKGGKAFSVY
jgi:hypothetical protein